MGLGRKDTGGKASGEKVLSPDPRGSSARDPVQTNPPTFVSLDSLMGNV